jgi:quinol monooxygenase YgiN
MLIVAGTFQLEPQERDDFLASREEPTKVSRSEAGCIEYVFSADPTDAGRVLLFEKWETKEALAAHLAAMRTAPPSSFTGKVISAEVLQYEISAVGPVGS